MNEVKKKCCIDCLNCKVSARSTDKKRLCYRSETVNKELHREMFWLHKAACLKFISMGTRKMTVRIEA